MCGEGDDLVGQILATERRASSEPAADDILRSSVSADVTSGCDPRSRMERHAFGSRRSELLANVVRPPTIALTGIETHQDATRWEIRIPEIDATTEASARAGVELAARECIAARTGIPLGYISVWVRD